MATKVGKIDRVPGFLFYVDKTGAVIRMPLHGHNKRKTKIGQVNRLENALCWIAKNGDVLCKKR